MADFGKAAVTETAPTIIGCFAKELDLLVNAGHNVEDMTDALSQLQASRDDLQNAMSNSHQQTPPELVSNWFERVQEVEDKAEKIQKDYSDRCRCMGSFSPNIFSSYAISRRAVQRHQKVKDLLQEYNTVKNLTSEYCPPASCIPKSVPTPIIGKGSYMTQVLAWIRDEDTRIISICGMAGVGKSELLRDINNRFLPGAEMGQAFKLVIWVDNASSSSDVKSVQDEIARRLKLDDLGDWEIDAEAPERRATPILSFLKDKSFLVLLDNLERPVSLADIGIPNPKFRRPCSLRQKVVLTTRFKGVCGRMQSCSRIDVGCLDGKDSWNLFLAAAAAGGEQLVIKDKEIEGFAQQIVRECGGLPIALTRIGGAMATKRHPDDWRRMAAFLESSQIHRIPGMERDNTVLLHDLKKSYDHGLSTPTDRECFLCCALWPRGRSINKADLIDCWIGLGLIREPSLDDAVQKGFSMISCMLEENLLMPGCNARDEVKLQEIVRDMALWIACDCGSRDNKWLVQAGVNLGAQTKLIELCQRAGAAERVSLMCNAIRELPRPHFLSSTCPALTVLMLQHNPAFTHIPAAFLRSAPALAYLDLSHTAIEQLPEDIGTLFNLQYLNASFTPLKMLPVGLRNLGRLRQLFLRHTNHLSAIPKGVLRCLTSLQAIDMYPSRYMDWTDDGDAASTEGEGNEGIASFEQMGSLMSTVFVQFLGITVNAIGTVQRLGRLINVCTRRLLLTRFDSPQHVTLCPSQFKAAMSSFSMLETLMELGIAECPTLEQLVLDGEEDESNRGPRNQSWCLPKLEALELRGLAKLEAVIWRSMSISFFLPALQRVKIENCGGLRSVGWAMRLPCLQHLELRGCTSMRSVICDEDLEPPQDGGEGQLLHTFPNLVTLILVNLTELRSFCSRPQVSLPWLEVIEVGCCVNLRRLHVMPQGRLREIRGTMEWWHGLEWDDDTVQASLHPYFINKSVE